MYEIRQVIDKMKTTASIKSNIELANLLNVSYNTLNTWIKRKKLPQEIIFDYCSTYNCSLDNLLLNKNNIDLFSNNDSCQQKRDDRNDNNIFSYYGNFPELNITVGSKLILNNALLHSGGYYLLLKENIHTIVQCNFYTINSCVQIIEHNTAYTVTFDNFKDYNLGLIENID